MNTETKESALNILLSPTSNPFDAANAARWLATAHANAPDVIDALLISVMNPSPLVREGVLKALRTLLRR